MTAYKTKARTLASHTETTVTACDRDRLNTKSQLSHKLKLRKPDVSIFLQHYHRIDTNQSFLENLGWRPVSYVHSRLSQ